MAAQRVPEELCELPQVLYLWLPSHVCTRLCGGRSWRDNGGCVRTETWSWKRKLSGTVLPSRPVVGWQGCERVGFGREKVPTGGRWRGSGRAAKKRRFFVW